MTQNNTPRLCFIGFGEAGQAFASGLCAAEMEEVADTLRELGIEPHMASATVQRQRQLGQVGKTGAIQRATEQDAKALLDAVSSTFAP